MKITPFAKRVAILNCCVPAILLGWDALLDDLGANPVNFAIRTTGLLAMIFLVLALAVTPLMRLTGRSWLGPFRRTLGVSAFAYAALHFVIYFSFDRGGNIADTFTEIRDRTYLTIGFGGLLLMVPLAATSTDAMIRRLGGRRWKRLHTLVYVAAIAGGLHFLLLVKADTTRPIIVLSILALLFAWRIAVHYRELHRAANRVLPMPVPAKHWQGMLRLAAILRETPNVKTFRFVLPGGGDIPFRHEPGQYLNLSLPIGGQTVRRSYTIASPPTRSASVDITVKREPEGLASRWLHDQARVGDLIAGSAPAGRFTFRGHEAESILMIAGGVGITPLMAKIRALADTAWHGKIHLLVSARTEREIIFRRELELLQSRHANLEVTITLTREESPEWVGLRGRIGPGLLRELLERYPGCRVHLCGPTEMTAPLVEVLESEGVSAERIRQESFASPSRAAASGPVVAFTEELAEGATLEFAQSGQSEASPANRTVLEIAESLGVAIPYDCRAGICGQCKTRLVAGSVHMDVEDALTAAEKSQGLILACQARCRDVVVVDA